jgi:chromosome segregation ATPase
MTTGEWIAIVAIIVPSVLSVTGAVVWWMRSSQREQDDAIRRLERSTDKMRVEVDEHQKELRDGSKKFDDLSGQIAHLSERAASTETSVRDVKGVVDKIDGKVDRLLERGRKE